MGDAYVSFELIMGSVWLLALSFGAPPPVTAFAGLFARLFSADGF